MVRLSLVAHLLPELVRTLLGQRSTVSFPFKPLEPPPYFRGKVIIESELCSGCGLCARDCPAFALELECKGRGEFRLLHYRDRCAYCGQCADSRQQGGITLVSECVQATPRSDALSHIMVERDAALG